MITRLVEAAYAARGPCAGGDVVVLSAALREEQEREQDADRVSWAPLRVELEALRRVRR